MPTASGPAEALRLHVTAFFQGHRIEQRDWTRGPIHRRVPEFSVYVAAPGPRLSMWSYITAGCWRAVHDAGHGLEFVLTANADGDRHVELLAMLAYYHAGAATQRLDYGHTVPIGEPWLPGSVCTHELIALPYAYGPDFETCAWEGGHIRLLAVLPITEAERELKIAEGIEALERRFEQAGIAFADPQRPSAV